MNEPVEVTEPLYHILMDLSIPGNSLLPAIPSLACACLFSLVTSLGHTGKVLQSVAKVLMMSPTSHNNDIPMPDILVNLQRSVISVMLDKLDHPDWLTNGIPQTAKLTYFPINFRYRIYMHISLHKCISNAC